MVYIPKNKRSESCLTLSDNSADLKANIQLIKFVGRSSASQFPGGCSAWGIKDEEGIIRKYEAKFNSDLDGNASISAGPICKKGIN